MLLNKPSDQNQIDLTGSINKSFLSSDQTSGPNLLVQASNGLQLPKDSFQLSLKFRQQRLWYFLLIFSNILYIGWCVAFVFWLWAIYEKAYLGVALIGVLMVIPGLIGVVFSHKASLQSFIFDLFQKAQSKQELLTFFNSLHNSNIKRQISLKTTIYDEDGPNTYKYQNPMTFLLSSSDQFTENYELSSLVDQHKLIIFEYQVYYSFDNPQVSTTLRKQQQKYREQNTKYTNQDKKIEIRSELEFDTSNLSSETSNLSLCCYAQLPDMKKIKFWGYFFAYIGLLIPFVIFLRCRIKRHKIRIVKNIKSISPH